MKTHRFLLLFLSTILSTTLAWASDGKSARIWIDAIGGATGITSGGIDFKVGDNWTFGPSGLYLKYDNPTISLKATGYGAYLSYYFSGAIKSSFRLQVLANYLPLTVTSGSYSGTVNTYSYGALIGYIWVPGLLSFGLGAGPIYYSTAGTLTLTNSSNQTQTMTTPAFTGVTTGVQLTAGLTF